MTSSSSSSSSTTNTTPEDRRDLPSNICSLGARPLLMTGALIRYLRSHFSAADSIEEISLRHLIWAADPATQQTAPGSPIVIEWVGRWDPKIANARSAIFVKRNDIQFQPSLGINQQHFGGADLEGNEYFSSPEQGSHTIMCLSPAPDETELLAREVGGWLRWFAPQLRVDLNLHRLVVANVGALHQVKEAADHYAVPITLAYVYVEQSTLHRHAPRLKEIKLSTSG